MKVRTAKLANVLVQGISEGIPLRELCRTHGVGFRTIYDWMDADPEFAARIARAREVGHEALAQQCLEIADDERHDWELSKKGVITNEVAIGRAKLRVWTRLQLLAKWDPKRYGDRTVVAGDPEAPLTTKVDLSQATAEQLRVLAALRLHGEKPDAADASPA